jgi:hypothetical protein
LLFVVDSSLSLLLERKKLARSISSFLDQLPHDADPRIAVMLGHGGSSDWNGELYSLKADPRVLDPRWLSRADAEEMLMRSIRSPALDHGWGGGEMLLHSLQSSLSEPHFNRIQMQGFYRPDAALAIIFLTDENDVCFDPRQNGYSMGAHYKPSAFGIEHLAYKTYCLNSQKALAVSPTSVIAALRDRFPGKRIAMAGIAHSNPDTVPWLGEAAIGHGILEIVWENANTQPTGPMPEMVLDIKSHDFAPTLSELGSLVSSHLSLLTLFPIPGSTNLLEPSLLVTVDGRSVPGTYDASTRRVRLSGALAGGAGSRIEISACEAH